VSTNPTVAQRLESLRLQFPGLIPEETLIARAWLDLNQQNFQAFQYNVRIGSGDDPGPGYPDYARKNAILNSQLRVDAVVWQGLANPAAVLDDTPPSTTYASNPNAQPTLIEFKRRAATAAVSQLLAYSHLWAADFPGQRPPLLLLVANTVSQTILPILARAGITLAQVQADFTILRRTSTYQAPPTA